MAFRRLFVVRRHTNSDRILPIFHAAFDSPIPSSSIYSYSSSSEEAADLKPRRDYYDEYRMAKYGGKLTHKALLVDAVGTLVIPSQPMAQVLSSSSFNLFRLFFSFPQKRTCLCCVLRYIERSGRSMG